MKPHLTIAAALAISASAAMAEDIGGTYAFDPEHSQAAFSYRHMGFSTSRGLVNGLTGTITLDQTDPSKSSVEARFPVGAIRTPNEALDAHLLGDDLFKGASADTPVTFRSTSVKPESDHEAKVTGDLTMNGVTRQVTLDVDLNKADKNPMTGAPSVGFSAETTIKRSAFNLGAFAPAVSDEVEIELSIEATRQ